MICPNCASNNENGAAFCEICGAKLTEQQYAPQMPQQTPNPQMLQQMPNPQMPQQPYYNYGQQAVTAPRPHTKMKASTKFIIFLILFLIAAAIVGYSVGTKLTMPEKTMQEYMDLMKSQDFLGAYSMMDVTESTFVNREIFEKSMETDETFKSISNFSYAEDMSNFGGNVNGQLAKRYIVKIKSTGAKKEQQKFITLISQKKKKWILFDNWKVSAQTYLVEGAGISAPKGATLTLENVELDPSYIDVVTDYTDSEDTDHYKIPVMFSGKYMITATAEGCEPSEILFVPSATEEAEISDLSVSQAIKDEVGEKASEVLKAIYAAAMNGKPFSQIADYFTKEKRSNFEYMYKDIVNMVKFDDGNGLKSLEISGFVPSTGEDASQDEMVIHLQYQYMYTYCRKDYWGNQPSEFTPDKLQSGESYFQFEKIDGEWIVVNMGDVKIYVHS